MNAPLEVSPPISNKDFDFFYRGLMEHRLLLQKCGQCGVLRNPPSPMCGACGSGVVEVLECSGGGVVHSYTVHHHPPLRGFPVPHPVALVRLDEGPAMVGALAAIGDADTLIGSRVHIEWLTVNGHETFRFVRSV